MTGRLQDAKSVLQAGIFQNIVVLFNFFPSYLLLCTDDSRKFEEVLRRATDIAGTFDMRHLHPGVLVGLYLSAAYGYAAQKNPERALDMLQEYTKIVTSDIYPLVLHGDAFFDLLDVWLTQLDLGNSLPRDEKTIRKSMAEAVVSNPAFSALMLEPRFKNIAERLQSNARSAEQKEGD